MLELRGKAAVVTGASRGIGKAIALLLAKNGASVTINYLTSEGGAFDLARLIEQNGSSCLVIKADVGEGSQVTSLVEEVLNRFGRIDILVNNAGAIPQPSDWEKLDSKVWQRTLDVNLKGTFNCIRAVAPHMLVKKPERS